MEQREGLLQQATYFIHHPRGSLRWTLAGITTALLASSLLLAATHSAPSTSPSLAQTIPTYAATSLEQSTVTALLQKILQPEIYESLADKRLPTLTEPLPPHTQVTPEDCQSLPQATIVEGVRFNFKRPPASIVYSEDTRINVSIATLKDNPPSNNISACKVILNPESIKQIFEDQFYPGLAFALAKRPVGFGEMGSNPGIIKPLEGNNIYRILVEPNMGVSYAVWKNGTTLPIGW